MTRYACRPRGRRAAGRGHLPFLGLLVGALILGLVLGLGHRQTAAHAFVQRSDPPANAILASPPKQITIWFTEPIEPAESTAQLYDQHGMLVPDVQSRMGSAPNQMIVTLAKPLANGTYSVLWEDISAADGHEAQGYFAFTVGTEANVAAVVPPPPPSGGGPPEWLQMVARWAAYLGLAAAVAVWPFWLFVLRPTLTVVERIGPAVIRRMQRLAIAALITAVAGDIFALLVQAGTGSGGYGHRLVTTVTDTRYGTFWLVRIGLLAAYAVLLLIVAWWQPWQRKVTTLPALALALALPIPFSAVAHASGESAGRVTAVSFDFFHLLAVGLWVGGLYCLVGTLPLILRRLEPGERRALLVRAIPRFSLLALSAWGVLGLTGFYSAWLQVGNWTALTQTSYGKALIIKVLLLIPVLLFAAFNLLVVSRRLREAKTDGQSARWSRHLLQAVVGEAVIVVLVLLVVGRLTSLPTGREVLASQAGQAVLHFQSNGRSATLSVAPATPGFNHDRLEVGGPTLPAGTVAILRISQAAQNTGLKDIQMVRAAGNAFEAHTSDFSLTGDWTIETIVRPPNQAEWTATKTLHIGDTPPTANAPNPPWRFHQGGLIGLVLLVLGIGSAAFAWFIGHSPLRKESVIFAAITVVLGVVILLEARTAAAANSAVATDPVPATLSAVTQGKKLFAADCAACHGIDGKGDGPAGKGIFPVPADFTAPHSKTHLDQDFFFWIKNGIQGSQMPAFKSKLSDQQVWEVIDYIRVQFQGRPMSGQTAATPSPPTSPRPRLGEGGLRYPLPALGEGGREAAG